MSEVHFHFFPGARMYVNGVEVPAADLHDVIRLHVTRGPSQPAVSRPPAELVPHLKLLGLT